MKYQFKKRNYKKANYGKEKSKTKNDSKFIKRIPPYEALTVKKNGS
jgi:hypothetical protein